MIIYRNVKHLNICISVVDSTKFVLCNNFIFRSENYKKLMQAMNEKDKLNFYFDPKTIDWKKYIEVCFFGIRKFILTNKKSASKN